MDKKEPEGLVPPCVPPTPDMPTTVAWGDERMAEEGAVGKDAASEEYISGFKLITVLFSLILVTFLVMLDASIVATVGVLTTNWRRIKTNLTYSLGRLSLKLRHIFIRSLTWVGTVAPTYLQIVLFNH